MLREMKDGKENPDVLESCRLEKNNKRIAEQRANVQVCDAFKNIVKQTPSAINATPAQGLRYVCY